MAEQNFRKYGWPIPVHLQATVADIAPDLQRTFTAAPSTPNVPSEPQSTADIEHSIRLAAGMGKIQEVDIAPTASRTDEKWRRTGNGEFEQITTGKVRLGRDGKPRRPPKRRNSNDIRRDQLVEAVLSEAKRTLFRNILRALTDPPSGLLRCTSASETSRIRYREQRRSFPCTVSGRILRVCRRSATAAAQAGASSRSERRERTSQGTETWWLEERTSKDATGRRASGKDKEVTFV
jgi:hypothetical protein